MLWAGNWGGKGLLFFSSPCGLPWEWFPSSSPHTSRRPRPKEIGPKEGRGVLPPFLMAFSGQMCICILPRRKGRVLLGRIWGRDGKSGFAGNPGSSSCCRCLGSKAQLVEMLSIFFEAPDLSRRPLPRSGGVDMQSCFTWENPHFKGASEISLQR